MKSVLEEWLCVRHLLEFRFSHGESHIHEARGEGEHNGIPKDVEDRTLLPT